MGKSYSYMRTPKYYDGTKLTTHRVNDLLGLVLSQIGNVYQHQPNLILESWHDVIGPKLAGMTQAVSFIDGVLTVKVKNSTLHSLLSQNDKPRILKSLRQRFPNVAIKTIVFRIG